MRCCFHTWSSWKEYWRQYSTTPTVLGRSVGPTENVDEIWQRRECLVCRYAQRKHLGVLNSWHQGHPLNIRGQS